MSYIVAGNQTETEGRVERSFELERIIFFSDAVFAIAITLLALELKLPNVPIQTSEQLLTALAEEWPAFFAFVLSFWIIGAYWQAHHRYYRYIIRYDEGLIIRNLLILFFVALLPFTTLVLGEYGNVPASLWLYAVDVAGVALSDMLLWHYATSHHRLVAGNLDAKLIRSLELRALVTPIVSVFVVGLSLVIGAGASYGWFLIFPIQRFVQSYVYKHTQT